MAFDLDNYKTGEEINEMLDRIERWGTTDEPNFELGVWSYPITNFLIRFRTLKRNSPQYSDEQAAAITYFAMVAEQPTPTGDFEDIAIDWDVVDSMNYDPSYGIDPNYYNVLFESYLRHQAYGYSDHKLEIGVEKDKKGKWKVMYNFVNVRLTRPLKESYIQSIYHLNRYLYYNGLYSGVQKTLSEESRKLQGLKAQADASAQAAAYALAMSRINENISEEVTEKYEKQLAEAQKQAQELKEYIDRVNNVPTGQGSVTTSGTSGVIPLAIGAALAALALR